MKKIGVLFGMENTFPGALVHRINSMELEDIRAEFVIVGGVEMNKPSQYSVIVDRISHDLPFYRAYLKNAALTGTHVINNPFWWSADDKFFNYALADRLGVAVPRTVLLPHKMYPPDINQQSVRNLEFPLNWQAIFDYVKFPAFLKPHDGGGWRDVYHVHDEREFFEAYDQSRDLCMTLQAAVKFREYFRCYVVGQREVRIMPYDPSRPHHLRYVQDPPAYDPALLARVERDALTLCRALGYDLNTVEFAVEDGVPYAIDFMNPAPDADYHSVGAENFEWIVDRMARLAVEKARLGPASAVLKWSSFLNPEGARSAEAASRGTSADRASAKDRTGARKSAAKKAAVGKGAATKAKGTKAAAAKGAASGRRSTPAKKAAATSPGTGEGQDFTRREVDDTTPVPDNEQP